MFKCIEMGTFSSKELCFIETTLSAQYEFAVKARNLQNFDRILFSKIFNEESTIMVGDIRVSVDANGRQAILSRGAQKCFTLEDYVHYTQGLNLDVINGEVVLRKK